MGNSEDRPVARSIESITDRRVHQKSVRRPALWPRRDLNVSQRPVANSSRAVLAGLFPRRL